MNQASTIEIDRGRSLAMEAAAARAKSEGVPGAGSENQVPDQEPAQAAQPSGQNLDQVSKFLMKQIAKAGNRYVPGWFDPKDIEEGAQLLAPVLGKHENVFLSIFDVWAEEIMLGVFVFNKSMDAMDIVKAKRGSNGKEKISSKKTTGKKTTGEEKTDQEETVEEHQANLLDRVSEFNFGSDKEKH